MYHPRATLRAPGCRSAVRLVLVEERDIVTKPRAVRRARKLQGPVGLWELCSKAYLDFCGLVVFDAVVSLPSQRMVVRLPSAPRLVETTTDVKSTYESYKGGGMDPMSTGDRAPR